MPIDMTGDTPIDLAEHRLRTREAYDRLAGVWAETTDDGPWNGHLERPALRSLVPPCLRGATILDAGCGSGAQAEWLLAQGASVIGLDLSGAMVTQAKHRCSDSDRGSFFVADLASPLPLVPDSVDGVTCSLVLHYLRDWSVALESFARILRPDGWVVLSLDHPFAAPLASQHGRYFDTELVSDTWQKADIRVTQHFWRRPLSATVNAFADAGFAVDRVVEARPSRAAIERFPEELTELDAVPTFIVYRLRVSRSA